MTDQTDLPIFTGCSIQKQKVPFFGGPVILQIWATLDQQESSMPHSLDDIGPTPPTFEVALSWKEAIAVGRSLQEAGEWSQLDPVTRS